jgi:hypothetical protein
MSGVYILKNENKSSNDKLYLKIGCSKNIDKRIEQIKKSFKFNGNLDDLIIYKTIECKSYMKLEKLIQSIMLSRKVTNEWFLTEESFLLRRLSMVDLSRYN